MNSADLFYHERLPIAANLVLERWGGILALTVLSGSVTVEKIEGLRADDSLAGRSVSENSAIVVFGPGRLSLSSGPTGAEILAQGTSDEELVDAVPQHTPSVCEISLDFTTVNRLKRLATQEKSGDALRLISRRHERFAALAALCDLAVHDEESERERKGAGYVERAIAQFRENIETKVRLPDVAWKVGITEEYLSKLFRAEIGMPPMKYFRMMKIAEAERLLSEGRWSVKEVSWMLGFASQHHFSKAFKALRGRNPSECKTGAATHDRSDDAQESESGRSAHAAALDDLGKEIDAATDR